MSNQFLIIGGIILILVIGGGLLFLKNQNNSVQPAGTSLTASPSPIESSQNITSSPTETVTPEASGQNTQTQTIEYTPQGFIPKTITVKIGTSVTWVNKDTDSVQVASNPHPTHTDYPPLNSVGQIQPNESKSFTFTKAGTYEYHNHLDPSNFGTVVVQP